MALYDENGKYLARAWFFRDITERARAEQALRESEENFRAIFSTVRESIFVTEPETGKFVEVNPSGCQMFGYSRDELVGADIGMISSGEPPYTLNDALGQPTRRPEGRRIPSSTGTAAGATANCSGPRSHLSAACFADASVSLRRFGTSPSERRPRTPYCGWPATIR